MDKLPCLICTGPQEKDAGIKERLWGFHHPFYGSWSVEFPGLLCSKCRKAFYKFVDDSWKKTQVKSTPNVADWEKDKEDIPDLENGYMLFTAGTNIKKGQIVFNNPKNEYVYPVREES